MECQQCRDAISARTDGEEPGAPDELVDSHLDRCASCRRWADDLGRRGRALRVAPIEPVPDLTAPILVAAAAAERRRPATTPGPARVSLALVGVAQLFLALPGLLGDASGASVHVAREHGSWELALAAGLLVAAVRPSRTAGLVPLLAVLTATLLGSTLIDVVNGHTTVDAESSHLLPLIGLAMLVLARRWAPAPSGTVDGRVTVRRAAAAALLTLVARRHPASLAALTALGAAAVAALLGWGSWSVQPAGAGGDALVPLVPLAAALAAGAALVPRWRPRRQVLALAAVALVGGWALLQLPALWHAVVPSELADPAVRAGLGVVAGLVVGAAVVAVRPSPG